MTKTISLTELILDKVGEIAATYCFDFVFEPEGDDGQPIAHVVKRDEEGSIIGTALVFRLFIEEELLEGEIIFYNQQGEFKRNKFNVEKGLIETLQFIDNHLALRFGRYTN